MRKIFNRLKHGLLAICMLFIFTMVNAQECPNFEYYLSDHLASDGISDVYKVSMNGFDAEMAFIAQSDIEIHIAYNQNDNLIYAISKHTNSFRTLNPVDGTWGNIVNFDTDCGEITTAVFNADNKLVIGSQNLNAAYIVNITTGVVSPYDEYSPISGGDMAFASDGMLFLATRSGNGLYENYPYPAFDNLIGNVPPLVTGLAITDIDQLLVSVQGNSSLELYDYTGNPTGDSYNLTLNGESYTLRDGDMASGCNSTINLEDGVCKKFSTYYINHGVGISGSDIYNVSFTEDGDANLDLLTNVPYEGHIAFNAADSILYIVNTDGSFVRLYNVVTDAYVGDLTLDDIYTKITAVTFSNGVLYVGDHNANKIYSINLDDGTSTFYANASVSGGDIVMSGTNLYLATRANASFYEITQTGNVTFNGYIPANVTGIALSNDSLVSVIMSNRNSGVFTKIDLNTTEISTYNVMLSGNPFTTSDGDMTSGCSDGEAPTTPNIENQLRSELTAFPNPTSGPTQIVFTTASTSKTLIEVYDMNGRNVSTIFNAETQGGLEQRLYYDGTTLANGVYICRMTTDNEIIISKFMVTK